MKLDPRRTAVLALHWQVNVIEPDGFFGPLLAEPVRRSGALHNAAHLHQAMRALEVPVYFTRFTVPDGEGQLVRNTVFMTMVGEAQQMFRPDSPGSQIVSDMSSLATPDMVVDNQKLSGLAGNDLPARLAEREITTVVLTGVATNLTVEQTARHATDLGLRVFPVRDCVAAADLEVHEASLANMEHTTRGAVTAAEVESALRQSFASPRPHRALDA